MGRLCWFEYSHSFGNAVCHFKAWLGSIRIRNGTVGLLTDPPLVEKMDVNLNRHALLRMGEIWFRSTSKGNPFSYKKEDGSIGTAPSALRIIVKLNLMV